VLMANFSNGAVQDGRDHLSTTLKNSATD